MKLFIYLLMKWYNIRDMHTHTKNTRNFLCFDYFIVNKLIGFRNSLIL